MASGGYRKPTNPAPVGLPGALSKRTDGGPAQVKSVPTGMAYGDAQALHAQEAVAPMSASPGGPGLDIPPPQDAPAAGGSGPSPVPFGAPTQRPNEPITSGVNIGAGPGQESLALEHTDTFAQQGPITQMMSQLSARDMTGSLATLFQFAQSQGV